MQEIRRLSKTTPVRISVIGFQHEGKSSLANTLVRAWENIDFLAKPENENVAEFPVKGSSIIFNTSPSGVDENTLKTKTWKDKNLFEITDTPALVDDDLSGQVRAVVRGIAQGTSRIAYGRSSNPSDKPDCIVCAISAREIFRNENQQVSKIRILGKLLREENISFVVALTFSDCLQSKDDLAKMRHAVASAAQTDSIFTLKNYIAERRGSLPLTRNLASTDLSTVQILHHVFENARAQQRSQ